jgi:ABC-type transport system involved in multi-copper enzyme maturation permease subunit
MTANPIVLKELLQAAHRRRTFFLRTALPAAALFVMAFILLLQYPREGATWRDMKGLLAPLFNTVAVAELLAFSFLSAAFAGPALADEWTRRTMEILCTTPLSRLQIVYGKFASVLGKVLLTGLALVPVLAAIMYAGHLPSELALRALGVIGASAVLFGGLTFVRAATLRPQRLLGRVTVDLLIVYLLLAFVLGLAAWPGDPRLVAAVPLWSFGYVLNGTSPSLISPGEFALLAILEPLGVGLAALALTPWMFRRALERYAGGGMPRRRRWNADGTPRRAWWRADRRPRLGLEQNPFYWQEKGGATAGLRCTLWGLYAALGLGLIIAGLAGAEISTDAEDWSTVLIVISQIGLWLLSLVTGLYALSVFAREKVRNTAAALMLTGNRPTAIYWAKVRATAWALRYQALGVLVPLAVGVALAPAHERSDLWDLVPYVGYGVLSLALALVVGLVFSAGARSTGQAFACGLLGGAWALAAGMCINPVWLVFAFIPSGFPGEALSPAMRVLIVASVPFGMGLVATVLLRLLIKVWTAFRLSFLLGATIIMGYGAVTAAVGLVLVLGGFWDPLPLERRLLSFSLPAAFMLGLLGFWFHLGVRAFDGSMLAKKKGG